MNVNYSMIVITTVGTQKVVILVDVNKDTSYNKITKSVKVCIRIFTTILRMPRLHAPLTFISILVEPAHQSQFLCSRLNRKNRLSEW